MKEQEGIKMDIFKNELKVLKKRAEGGGNKKEWRKEDKDLPFSYSPGHIFLGILACMYVYILYWQ